MRFGQFPPLVLLIVGLGSGLSLGRAAPADDAAKLVGTWTWQWKDEQGQTHKHVLEIEGAGAKLAARERFDEAEPVKIEDLKVEGPKVNFSVMRGDRRSSYTGTLAADDTINGEVTISREGTDKVFGWTARREPVAKKPSGSR